MLYHIRKGKEMVHALAWARSIQEHLPAGVRAMALDEEHWNPKCETCLHDAWVQELSVREVPINPQDISEPHRHIQIVVRLLSWSHKHIEMLTYEGVSRYSFGLKQLSDSGNRAHSDWLDDHFDVDDDGAIIHRIRFSNGAKWEIYCRDMTFSQVPIKQPTE